MSIFGGTYQLGPGDVVPFTGTDVEAKENLATHSFVTVPTPRPDVVVPEAWKHAGDLPKFVEQCSVCRMYAPSEAVKYPCGKANRLGPSEYLRLAKRPSGWIFENRIKP